MSAIEDLSRRARRKDIDDAVMREFRAADFCALYVAGPIDLVPRKMGDNRGGRPIKIGLTRSMQDTISANMDGASPYWEQRMLFRVWVEGHATARRLESLVLDALVNGAEERLRKSYHEMGAEFDTAFFEMEVHNIAMVNAITAYDDDSMMIALARRVHGKMARRAKQ